MSANAENLVNIGPLYLVIIGLLAIIKKRKKLEMLGKV